MSRRIAVIATLALLAAFSCGDEPRTTDDDNGSNGGGEPSSTACDDYLGCVAAAEPQSVGPAIDVYGAQGSCWQELSTDQCRAACASLREQLAMAYPSVEACGGGGTGGGGGSGAGGGCTGPCGHLLISEIVVTPTSAELVEVFNPLGVAVSLGDVWLADFPDYYTVTTGAPSVGATDFLVQFPPGSSIEPGQRLVVAIDAAGEFAIAYGQPPDFDIHSMPGTATAGMSALANGDEMLVLFRWDGAAPLVQDLDYVIWGDTSDAVDKTGVTVGGQTYLADTSGDQQSVVGAPQGNSALHRCDNDEPGETKQGGNGVVGHDETSENIAAAFAEGVPTPNAAPPAGVCP